MTYNVVRDGNVVAAMDDKGKTIRMAYMLLAGLAESERASYAIKDGEDRLVANVTNRRIEGVFVKQEWDSRDYAITLGREKFDGTDAVLLLDLERIHFLQDNSDGTDHIGQLHVAWHGPHEVEIVESVKAYFGVDGLEEVTQEALEFARDREQPVAPKRVEVEMKVKVSLLVSKGVDIAAVVAGMERSFASTTAGAVVVDAKLVGHQVQTEQKECEQVDA